MRIAEGKGTYSAAWWIQILAICESSLSVPLAVSDLQRGFEIPFGLTDNTA